MYFSSGICVFLFNFASYLVLLLLISSYLEDALGVVDFDFA